MILFLDRPLAFFDIEATGLDVAKDHIISIAVKKIHPDGGVDTFERIINPGIPITPGASEKNGFTDEMVKDLPSFQYIHPDLAQFIRGCDLGGYNLLNFDVPILYEEFARCDLDWDLTGIRIVDCGNIFKKKEERTLTAAVRFYCFKEMENAHNAMADVDATADVLDGQLQRYTDLAAMDIDKLAAFSRMDERIDLAGKIVRNEKGEAVYNFGKAKGVRVLDDPGFGNWILRNDFTQNTKRVVSDLLDGGAS